MRNTTGGNKHKKQAKGAIEARSKIEFADKEQFYAECTNINGHSKFEVILYDKDERGEFIGNKYLANARSNLKKKRMFVNKGSIMIVSKRDFQEGICDILYVYKDNQVSVLKKKKLIPSSASDTKGDDENVFGYDDQDEDEDQDQQLETPKPRSNNEPYFDYGSIIDDDVEYGSESDLEVM